MTNDVSTNISDVQLQIAFLIKPTINMLNVPFDKVIQGNTPTTYFE
jgi:hypothetical protein